MSRFMIKYGEKDHLEQIINGLIRFSPSQSYIKIEEALHNKGQGDLLEGKLKLKSYGTRIYDPQNDDLILELPSNIDLIVSIQNVNNMPVFCLTEYGDADISDFVNDSNYTISLSGEKLHGIQSDFPKATHALIILEPDKFINDIKNIENHLFVSDRIHYYDYDMNYLQMFMYLITGSETMAVNTEMSMTYENRYRHLLCKDISFSNQEEYRFIELNELITEPVFYPITFTSKYLIVPIEQLYHPLQIRL